LKLNGTLQLPVYFDGVNILGESVRGIMKNTDALVVASKETRLKVMLIKIKCMDISRDQNTG